MALLAEVLVEEWLNRQGYFTMRGSKIGNSEIDLLAVSFRETDALHVEVSVSTNARSWTCPWTKRLRNELGYDKGPDKPRTRQQMEECVEEWISGKYRDNNPGDGKVAERREAFCPGREWRFMFVHGDIKYQQELTLISERGVELKDIREVLEELRDRKRTPFATSSEASDIAALMDIYCKAL